MSALILALASGALLGAIASVLDRRSSQTARARLALTIASVVFVIALGIDLGVR